MLLANNNITKKIFIFILLSYMLLSAFLFRYGTAFSDEGLTYQQAIRILNGELPYTDFYMIQAPGVFYVQSLLIKLFGMNILVGRIFKQIQGLFVGILTYLIIAQFLKNKPAALISMAISFVWSGALQIRFHWYTMDAAIMVLIGVYFFIRFFMESLRLKDLILCGLSMGSSILFKQNMGIAALLVGILLLFIYSLKEKRMDSLKWIFIFLATALIPPVLFISYYIWAGGDLYKLCIQAIVGLHKIYAYQSLWAMAVYPLRVFSLLYTQDSRYLIGILIMFLSFFLIFAKIRMRFAKILGCLLVAGLILWDKAIFVRFAIWTAIFIILIFAVIVSAYDFFRNRNDIRSFCRLALSLFAFVNLYVGIMVGGGFGRFAEIMAGGFYVYAVTADLIENSQSLSAFWQRRISWSKRQFIYSGVIFYLILGLMLIIENAGFLPGLDFPLYRLNQTMRIPGARGVIGESNYVSETEAAVDYTKNTLALKKSKKREIFVFPLNSMLYPLIGAKNPTAYDTLQAIPFIPELIPDLIKQLQVALPEIIIMQKRATPTTGPLSEEKVWVDQRAVSAIYKLIGNNYDKIYETRFYYEVYGLRTSK